MQIVPDLWQQLGTIVTQNVFDYKQAKVKTLIQHDNRVISLPGENKEIV